MVYFYSRKIVKCYLEDWRDKCAIGNVALNIEYEFTHAGQQDGHGPWHRDDRRDFAECVIRNIEREPIAVLLRDNGIIGINGIDHTSINVKPLNVLDKNCFMPLYHMHLKIFFRPLEDTHLSLACQLIDHIPWQVAKEGIFEGHSCSVDWEFGKQGSKDGGLLRSEDVNNT